MAGMLKLSAALVILLFIAMATPAHASPVVANVSIVVINVESNQVDSGQYKVDFYLTFTCKTNCTTDSFEFVNGRAETSTLIYDNGTEKDYRILGDFTEDVSLKDYPFDTHHLAIVMEDDQLTTTDLVYVADVGHTALDPEAKFYGWDVQGWNASVTDHYYPVFGETYSRYTYQINIKRISEDSLLKIFLPVLLIFLTGLIAIFLSPSDPNIFAGRIGLVVSALIAETVFYFAIVGSLPPVGYLTFFDEFMLVTYFSLLANMVGTTIVGAYFFEAAKTNGRPANEKKMMQADRLVRYIVPIITILALIFVIVQSNIHF